MDNKRKSYFPTAKVEMEMLVKKLEDEGSCREVANTIFRSLKCKGCKQNLKNLLNKENYDN